MPFLEPTVAQLVSQIDSRLAELAEQDDHLARTERGIAEQRMAVAEQRERLEIAKAVALTLTMPVAATQIEAGEPEVVQEAPGSRSTSRPTIIDAAAGYLEEVGGEADLKPMTIALIQRGQLRGEKPDRTLSTQLYRAAEKPDARVHKVGRGRWKLGPKPSPELEPSPAWRSDVMERLRTANGERHRIQSEMVLERLGGT